MIQNINVEGLKPEQIQQILTLIQVLKAKNKNNIIEPEIDMIEYLLENPIHVNTLDFLNREDIYDRK
ncbi:MAG: hypothetical protein F6K31_13855 [Symploca sp. SIO2G7]|nr:hypothetical protein [Symploca sp. SIO2G7]